MIASLWNRDLVLSDEQVDRLQTWILDRDASHLRDRLT